LGHSTSIGVDLPLLAPDGQGCSLQDSNHATKSAFHCSNQPACKSWTGFTTHEVLYYRRWRKHSGLPCAHTVLLGTQTKVAYTRVIRVSAWDVFHLVRYNFQVGTSHTA
jgi:hypothetical protein